MKKGLLGELYCLLLLGPTSSTFLVYFYLGKAEQGKLTEGKNGCQT